MKILNVVGARPNFMKVAPIHAELARRDGVRSSVVHTGQHYDERMSDVFFRQLGMPRPDAYLEVGSGSHAVQTAKVMTSFEELVLADRPDVVLVVGDVNSTLACALVAAKLDIPVVHVEAGLRSGDRRMPEEINRILTDALSDALFVTEPSGVENLRGEGVPDERIHLVGNVMIDTLVRLRGAARATETRERFGFADSTYGLATIHRPSNVDAPEPAGLISRTLLEVAKSLPLVFPVHPRTRGKFEEFGLLESLIEAGVQLIEPLGYLEFLDLMEGAAVVLTDSGGIQEETTFLGVPCITLRENTERPITIEVGTNQLLPIDPEIVAAEVADILGSPVSNRAVPPLWDGKAAPRIVEILLDEFN